MFVTLMMSVRRIWTTCGKSANDTNKPNWHNVFIQPKNGVEWLAVLSWLLCISGHLVVPRWRRSFFLAALEEHNIGWPGLGVALSFSSSRLFFFGLEFVRLMIGRLYTYLDTYLPPLSIIV